MIGDDDETSNGEFPKTRFRTCFCHSPAELAPSGSLRCGLYDGNMKISGELIRVEWDQKVWLKPPGIAEPIAVPLDALQSVIALNKTKTDPPELPQRRGRLEVAGMALHGCLVDGTEGENSCLQWQPLRSSNSSPLQRGISARVIYRDPPPPVQSNPVTNVPGGGMQAVPGRVVRTTTRRTSKKSGSVLHLRTGDMIPCEPISIDEKGLTFKSSVTEASFVPHDQIKVLELIADAATPVEIAKS